MWEINNATIAGLAVGVVVTLVMGKWVTDLMPKRQVFTARGTIYVFVIAATAWSLWTLARVIATGDPIVSGIASMFLVTMGCIVLVTACLGYAIRLLWKRVDAIEQHVGPSTR